MISLRYQSVSSDAACRRSRCAAAIDGPRLGLIGDVTFAFHACIHLTMFQDGQREGVDKPVYTISDYLVVRSFISRLPAL
jgi:hypothetical protein